MNFLFKIIFNLQFGKYIDFQNFENHFYFDNLENNQNFKYF